MLCFNSWEHYESVMEALETACDNYTNDFFQSLKAELGENVESDELNDSADARGFNQFYPLHVFCDSLNFSSLYEYIEAQEIEWMNVENANIEENPFYNTCFERYESVLHNINGDVIIETSIYNPSDPNQKDNCKRTGSIDGYSQIFTYHGIGRVVLGKLMGRQNSVVSATTLYKIKGGRFKYWYDCIITQNGGRTSAICPGFLYNYHSTTTAIATNNCYKVARNTKDGGGYLIHELSSVHWSTATNPDVIIYLSL
jgi:hypothetical protein